MSIKRILYNLDRECCQICKFIDEYAANVADDGEVPHGYDGVAACLAWNENEEESPDNRMFISPVWKPCKKYEKCTERQADYLDIYDREKGIIENPNDISKIS